MNFAHDANDFDELLQIVAAERKLTPALVEKDYWVTHTLWALHKQGFDVWFKGGTSLSKGFGLIERFSEDLDLKVEPGSVAGLSPVANWKSDGTKARNERRAYFKTLATLVSVPGAEASLDPTFGTDKSWRGANVRVAYPGKHLANLGVMSPFVRLEVGVARVTPFVARDMSSFVHEKLATLGQAAEYDDNRPKGVRCVHPLVTLLEKLDALHRHFPGDKEPAFFVRHYEDAARIIRAMSKLPPIVGYPDATALVAEMLAEKQLAAPPIATDLAFAPSAGERWVAIRAAHAAIDPMFWGPRVMLDDACAEVRTWIASALP